MPETAFAALTPLLVMLASLVASAFCALRLGRPVPSLVTGGLVPAPRRIGAYVLEARLGAGAMGEVYRARDTRSGHLRALKLLGAGASDHTRRQFEREARLGAELSHPNTVQVTEHGRAGDGTRYFAMELLEGTTLELLVEREGAQPAERVIGILLQLCAALEAAHARGLLHRDIKPSNVVLCRAADGADVVKLVDFGLVKRIDEPRDAAESLDHVVGTPLYIAPEAITSPGDVDARTDLYGVGAVAYFLLSGAPVFSGRSVLELCTQHLLAQPRPLDVRADLARAVHACLAKDPGERPASAAALAQLLERCRAAAVHVRAAAAPGRTLSCSGVLPGAALRRPAPWGSPACPCAA